VFQDYDSQGIAFHVLIWDPWDRVCDSSNLDGAYSMSHMWTWDPNIIYVLIHVLLEDKQYYIKEDCNVPTLGHHYIAKCYDEHSSHMEVIATTGDIEGIFWVRVPSLILFNHHDPLCIAWLWLHCILSIFAILSYFLLYVN